MKLNCNSVSLTTPIPSGSTRFVVGRCTLHVFILKLEFKFQVKLTMSSLKSIEVKNSSGIIRPKQKSFVHFMCKASKNRLNVMSCYFIRCSKNFFFLSHGSQLERVAPQVFDSSPARPSAAESQEFGNRAKSAASSLQRDRQEQAERCVGADRDRRRETARNEDPACRRSKRERKSRAFRQPSSR